MPSTAARSGAASVGAAVAFASILAALCLAASAPALQAQEEAVAPAPLALVGGQLHYHLPPAENGGLVALRFAAPLAPLGVHRWLLESSGGYGWYHGTDALLHHLLLGEMQLQLQLGADPVQPYVGVGGGLAARRVDSTTRVQVTFSTAAGLRLGILRNLGVVGEVRLRRHDLFEGWTRELTVGLMGLIR
jgi:hypothetical protein